jgi:hypothetical protein
MAKVEVKETHLLTMMDIMVLLVNLHLAAQDEDISHGDPDKSLRDLTKHLTKKRKNQFEKEAAPRRFPVDQDILESALWACNMMNEKKKFWSPYQRKESVKFNEYLKTVLKEDQVFDLDYNYIKPRLKKDRT